MWLTDRPEASSSASAPAVKAPRRPPPSSTKTVPELATFTADPGAARDAARPTLLAALGCFHNPGKRLNREAGHKSDCPGREAEYHGASHERLERTGAPAIFEFAHGTRTFPVRGFGLRAHGGLAKPERLLATVSAARVARGF